MLFYLLFHSSFRHFFDFSLLLIFSLWPSCALLSSALQDSTIRPELIEALLSESLRLNLVQACQDQRVSLHCPRHTHISPINSFFGRLVPSRELCPSAGRTAPVSTALGPQQYQQQHQQQQQEDISCDFAEANSRVQEICRAKRKCRLWVRPELFGERDPCPSTGKYLQIGYKCSPVSFEDQNFCEGQQTRLGCKSGKRLSIYSAHYGRTANGQALHCGGGDKKEDTNGGTMDQGDCVSDVLPQIARRCHAQPSCSFPVDDRFLGSPCRPGVPKYLSIIYACVNEEVFSEAALKGNLEAMEQLGKELDALQRNETMTTTPMGMGNKVGRHPLLGEDESEEEEEEHEEKEEKIKMNGRRMNKEEEEENIMIKMEVREEKDGTTVEEEDGQKAKEKQQMAKMKTANVGWPWGMMMSRDGHGNDVHPWLLLLLSLFFLFSMLFLSACLFWQCHARANERKERKIAEERAASKGTKQVLNGGGRRAMAFEDNPSPAYFDSDGSSQRLLDGFLPPPSMPYQPPMALHSDIYHGCYVPSGGSSTGTASAYGGGGRGRIGTPGGGGGGDGTGSGYYCGLGREEGGLMFDGLERMRRMPTSMHYYS